MEIAFDATWCPVCSRQILPKRYQVPIAPPPPPVTPAPPSSPTSQPKSEVAMARPTRTKTGTIRARTGGLVHGTGRVKPNGAIKRSDPSKEHPQPTKKAAPTTAEPPKSIAPIRHRTVIDQGPIPLYCSDECRLADLQSSHDAVSIDYKPERHTGPERVSSPPLPPVPNNSYSDLSDSSLSSTSTVSPAKPNAELPISSNPATARAYAALASIYDIPPCPPPPPVFRSDSDSSDDSAARYDSGVMMAARRIKEVLMTPQPAKRPSSQAALTAAYATGANSRVHDPIPGWTDGSDAWRASVYSFSKPPKDGVFKTGDDDDSRKAYKSFVATSHRSHGVYSTVGESNVSSGSSASVYTTNNGLPGRSQSDVDELYSKFSDSLSRRSESRAQMAAHHALSTSPTGSAKSLPTTITASSSRRSLVAKGAEGKLLVPNVTMRRTPSNISSYGGSSSASCSSFAPGASTRKRSPLSRQNSDMSVEEEANADVTMKPSSRRPPPEVRSWSYSDLYTYPIMQLPPKKEKRIEKRVIDGKEIEVEYEVEVYPERKRLFLFPGKEALPQPTH